MTQEPESKESDKPTNSSPNKRWLINSLGTIARWLPLGGTIFPFASFLLQQEWVTALALLPVTAVSGIWAAYSKNFIDELIRLYSERATQDARSFVEWLDNLNQILKESIE
jgi:hypothetical protein